jgi:isopenicillin N synthase-like dioxygenase
VQLPNGEWVYAPVVDGAFTINAGDMLAHWSGGRWRSAIHRMPTPTAPDDGLLSLVYFCDPDPDTLVVPLRGNAPPVLAGDYLTAKIAAITMGPAT